MKFKHIFFDLDNTLWDFEKNSNITLTYLVGKFDLISKGIDNAASFIKKYRVHNDHLWSLYREDKISKNELRTERFRLTLQEYKIDNQELADNIGLAYIQQSPLKTILFPFAVEVLEYLYQNYTLHIITNGFEEVQHIKINSSGLKSYFNNIITSEQVGVKKPDSRIFRHALEKANALANESLMIGDDLPVDILGAKDIGIKGVYFNPKGNLHTEDIWKEISSLKELIQIL